MVRLGERGPVGMHQHVQELFDGPVDIVADIHGEIIALDALLERLGYTPDGRHPRGCRLVFLGDLVDRGADSPAVVERVADMVAAGRAQCVLGNHELNLLCEAPKEGNGWFWPAEFDHDVANGKFADSVRASDSQRRHFRRWFDTLPVALERSDLRVVHACWQGETIQRLRDSTAPASEAYDVFNGQVADALHRSGRYEQRTQELAEWGGRLVDPAATVPLLRSLAAIDTLRQSGHPLRAATSGLERPALAPFYASGKWRMNERVAWWNEYDDAPAVVFGHYWRWPLSAVEAAARSRGPDLFAGAEPFEWLGPRKNAMCIDWCVGLRWKERLTGVRRFEGKLGALRWPSREVVLDS